jgi:hypothetical protein
MANKARDVLASADEILIERGQQYGDADLLFTNTATRFSLVLGQYVTPYQACRLMAELKAARLDLGYAEDHVVDQINYVALASELRRDQP